MSDYTKHAYEGETYNFSYDRQLASYGNNWQQSKQYIVSDKTITWADGRRQKLNHLERPQLYFENDKPVALICAADTLDANGVRQTFNIQIPIVVSEY